MNTLNRLGLISLLLLAPTVAGWAGQGKPIDIVFPKNSKVATVKGTLATKTSKALFQFKAEKGLKLEVKADAPGTPVVMVNFPDATSDGGPGGIETEVPKAGLCKIEVYSKNKDWKGKFTLTVKKLN